MLLDQGAPRSAGVLLRQAGFDAVHTGEIGMAESLDDEITRYAVAQERTIVTFDADFHAHLARSAAKKPSVIRVRIEGLRAHEFVSLLIQVLEQCRTDLDEGAVVSVQETRIHVRRLPIA